MFKASEKIEAPPELKTKNSTPSLRQRLTNRANLPDAIVQAVRNDPYTKGNATLSVTGLLKSPRMSVLEAKYGHEITEDASDRVWSLLGQSVHTILERANKTAIAERRLSMEIEGWVVSGGMDLYQEEGILSDFKVTSVWKLISGSLEEWNSQLNLYSVLLRHHGHAVKQLQVIAILRDWSKMEAARNPEYPQAQVVNVPIPLWEASTALEFMRQRIKLHQQAQNALELPLCTGEERWAKPDVYAVMKAGRKSAVKLCTTEDEALEMACSDKNFYVVHRPGMSVRCEAYCPCLPFCDQGQSLIKKQKPNSNQENSNVVHAAS